MAKLTEAEKKQIQIEYAAGASTRELAEKFSVSQTAIAKLLKQPKSVQKCSKVFGKCSGDLDDEPEQKRLSNRDCARDIVSKAYDALLDRDYSKVQPETLLKIIDRMTDIYGAEALEKEETEEVTEIVVTIEDASDEAED